MMNKRAQRPTALLALCTVVLVISMLYLEDLRRNRMESTLDNRVAEWEAITYIRRIKDTVMPDEQQDTITDELVEEDQDPSGDDDETQQSLEALDFDEAIMAGDKIVTHLPDVKEKGHMIPLQKTFPEQPYDLFLVTGASSNHFNSLLYTVTNARAQEPQLPVIVWDFGMAPEEVEQVKRWRNVEYRQFNFTDYPEWMQMNAVGKGQYSWKIIAIYLTAVDYRRVMWLDGDIDVTCDFTLVRDELALQGFYGRGLPGPVLTWVHPGMFNYLGLKAENYEKKTMLAGGINGFNADHPKGVRLLQRWFDCGVVLNCIGPTGATRDNHRQDQSALTVLAHDEKMHIPNYRNSCIRPHSYKKCDFAKLSQDLMVKKK